MLNIDGFDNRNVVIWNNHFFVLLSVKVTNRWYNYKAETKTYVQDGGVHRVQACDGGQQRGLVGVRRRGDGIQSLQQNNQGPQMLARQPEHIAQ